MVQDWIDGGNSKRPKTNEPMGQVLKRQVPAPQVKAMMERMVPIYGRTRQGGFEKRQVGVYKILLLVP